MTDAFNGLPELASYLRGKLETDPTSRKKFVLLFAYNGTGKTRLSTAFKDMGKTTVSEYLTTEDGDPIVTEEVVQGDTLYFNAFTEDLFTWYNDLQGDQDRVLQLNSDLTAIRSTQTSSRKRLYPKAILHYDRTRQ